MTINNSTISLKEILQYMMTNSIIFAYRKPANTFNVETNIQIFNGSQNNKFDKSFRRKRILSYRKLQKFFFTFSMRI